MSSISPTSGGDSSSGPLPSDVVGRANALRTQIGSFSECIRQGDPSNENDVAELGRAIEAINTLTLGGG